MKIKIYLINLTPLNTFKEQIPIKVIEIATQNMANFLAVTGRQHGDLHQENIQIQTVIGEEGLPQYKVWILDPCGAFGSEVEVISTKDEGIVRNLLYAMNIANG